MTTDLIYPASVFGSENYSSEPPLGPVALYSSLPEDMRKAVRFLDSTLIPQAEIEQAVLSRKADLVAVSCTTFNYPNALRIAELAKRNGSRVVCGGIHVTYMRDAILAKMGVMCFCGVSMDASLDIIGDEKYSARTDPAKRLGLHAWLLKFRHPITGKDLQFESPLPPELAKLF